MDNKEIFKALCLEAYKRHDNWNIVEWQSSLLFDTGREVLELTPDEIDKIYRDVFGYVWDDEL